MAGFNLRNRDIALISHLSLKKASFTQFAKSGEPGIKPLTMLPDGLSITPLSADGPYYLYPYFPSVWLYNRLLSLNSMLLEIEPILAIVNN
jgi:hypothetical protein